MDIKPANFILQNKILRIIFNKVPENNFIDYKQEWESKNSELVKDIFSFVNTIHNKDCYLIYGVTDKNKSIIGVNSDGNRKDQKDIIDILNQLPIAGGYIPPVRVNTITYHDKQIDVLVIKNTRVVPIYLSKPYHFKKDKVLEPGLIYSRIRDRNTGINQITNFHRVKMLWEKRFGLGLPIKLKYKIALNNVNNWKYHDQLLPGSKPCFIYSLNPNYKITFIDDEVANRKVSPLSSTMILRPKIPGWFYLNLEYNHNTIDIGYGLYLDACNSLVIYPETYFCDGLKDNQELISYYFVKNSMKWLLNKMVFKLYTRSMFQNMPIHEQWDIFDRYYNNLNKLIIEFNNENEKVQFYKYSQKMITKTTFKNKYRIFYKHLYKGEFKQDGLNLTDFQFNKLRNEYASTRTYKDLYNQWISK